MTREEQSPLHQETQCLISELVGCRHPQSGLFKRTWLYSPNNKYLPHISILMEGNIVTRNNRIFKTHIRYLKRLGLFLFSHSHPNRMSVSMETPPSSQTHLDFTDGIICNSHFQANVYNQMGSVVFLM